MTFIPAIDPDIEYPDSDGKPMADNTEQYEWIVKIKEKIVAGRIEKRLKELSLLDQPFIRDQNISIDELLKQAIAALGENIQVRRFQRFVLGEGIEKEETDFAAEVAAQMGQKAPEPVAAAPQVEEKAPEPAAKDNPPAKGKKKK